MQPKDHKPGGNAPGHAGGTMATAMAAGIGAAPRGAAPRPAWEKATNPRTPGHRSCRYGLQIGKGFTHCISPACL
jgi:hypothetical protein